MSRRVCDEAAEPRSVWVDYADASGRERDPAPVGRPRWGGAVQPACKPGEMTSVRCGGVEVVLSVTGSVVAAERQVAAVRRPRRIPFGEGGREGPAGASVGAHQADAVRTLVGNLASKVLGPGRNPATQACGRAEHAANRGGRRRTCRWSLARWPGWMSSEPGQQG